MNKYRVAIVRYRNKIKSVSKAIELSDAFKNLSGNEKVFLKPNIVYWSCEPFYPKYGVVTTSRVVEDTIIALKDRGISDIIIGEGIIVMDPKDFETPRHAFETLGYNKFIKRHGVSVINVFERPFERVDLGDETELNFNTDALYSDFIVSIPVLKTHAQTKVSLALKNLKGLIDVNSRKKCHTAETEKDLEFFISHLSNKLPPTAAVIDGIYTNERGPNYDGKMRRKDIIIASSDMFSADKVGAKILGYDPSDVKYFNYYAEYHNRPIDLSDVEIVGRKVEKVQDFHEYKFPYTEDGSMPKIFKHRGVKGLYYWNYDNSLCTYCSMLTSRVLEAISLAWYGKPWDDIEVLTGKRMNPTGKKKTILLGQCMFNKHRNNPDIKELIAIKGCPPKLENITNALHRAGINVNPEYLDNLEKIPLLHGMRYWHRFNEFEESFFNEDVKTETVPTLDNIIVSQTYFDNGENNSNMPKMQTRFEAMFRGLFGEKFTNAINNIIVQGPNNYEFKILNQAFDFKNGNGYIVDRMNFDQIRYVGFDRNGFLEDGEYSITINYRNEEKRSKSKMLKSHNKLLNAYLANKDKISYFPTGKVAQDIKKPFYTKWSTLDELAGANAYYLNWVSEGFSEYIDFHKLYFYDNMFLISFLMPSYGLNKNFAWINDSRINVKPNTNYTWFTEICDSNRYEDLNLSIFQPQQHFKTI
ncbi:MAG: DUF362 domain-containing protein [Promethearchaeota archaeon]